MSEADQEWRDSSNPSLKPRSLYRELTAAVVISLTLIALVFSALNYLFAVNDQNLRQEERAARYQSDLVRLLEPPLWSIDDELVIKISTALATNRNFASLSVSDENHRVIYDYDAKTASSDRIKLVITHGSTVVGYVEFSLSLDAAVEMRQRALFSTVGFTLLLVLVLLVSLRRTLQKLLKGPVDELVKATQKVVEGQYLTLPQSSTYSEFAPIVSSINRMSAAVAAREESLRSSEEAFKGTFNQAAVGIALVGTNGAWLKVNRKLCEILGYSEEELLQLTFQDVTHPDDLETDLALVAQVLSGEIDTYAMQKRYFRKSHDVVWVNLTVSLVRNASGKPDYFISVIEDITHRKADEAELTRYKDHLEEEVQARTTDLMLARNAAETANRAKSVFLANMSHELRTPLNAILGFSNLMLTESGVNEAQRNYLQIINRSGNHLLTLINDVLDMAKIEAGKTQLEIAPFNLGAMVRDVTDMMNIRAEEKGLRLLLDQSSSFPAFIHGDEPRLRQILINLLSNAIKFTQQGGVTLRLGTRANAGIHLLIEVEDSGPGITAEEQKMLFQPFVQLGKQAADNTGSGLGLVITRQFVELMGGKISVDSTPGKGSTFRVDLPAEPAQADEVEKVQNLAGAVVLGLAPGQPDFRVLIVEDQMENQLLLKRLIVDVGLQAKVASNGKEGVALFQSWQPHLILMDRRMPGMDGIEATRAIRDLPGGKEVKIVAVTASAFKEQQNEMLEAGMDDFVRKPYRFHEIYDCLTRQLGVRFLYAKTNGEEDSSPHVILTAAMLDVLPMTLREELRTALNSLDSNRILGAIAQVEPIDPTLFKLLTRIAEEFDYPAILKALGGQDKERT